MTYEHVVVTGAATSESHGYLFANGWMSLGTYEGEAAAKPPEHEPLSKMLDDQAQRGFTFLFVMPDPGPDAHGHPRVSVMVRKERDSARDRITRRTYRSEQANVARDRPRDEDA